ncbi:MAG: response regulator, partial [Myxococcota bacterium]
MALSIRRQLEYLGYQVPAVFANGEDAVAFCEREPVDLILMDIILDGELDGVDTAHDIRERRDIPVVYLTANSDEGTLQRAKRTEPYGYLLKPFEERELYTTIEMALSKHQLEQKVKKSQSWLSTVLNGIADAVIATDAEGAIQFMNPVAERLTGWCGEEAIQRPLDDVLVVVDEASRRSPDHDTAARVLTDQGIMHLPDNALLIAKNKNEVPVDGSASPIVDRYGDVSGVVLVFRDITQRRIAETALRDAKRRLEDQVAIRTAELSQTNEQLQRELLERQRALVQLEVSNRELDSFAQTVAHDLRNPLNIIVGYADLLVSEAELADEFHDFAERILRTGHRMVQITQALLLLARVRDSDVPLEALAMADVIAQCRERMSPLVDSAGVELIVAETWPRARGYGPWIEEVWANYISNAIKYGGSPPRVELGSSPTVAGRIRFWVRDNGAGLSADERAVLFTEFTQLERHKQQGKGHGLGLSIVKRIIVFCRQFKVERGALAGLAVDPDPAAQLV